VRKLALFYKKGEMCYNPEMNRTWSFFKKDICKFFNSVRTRVIIGILAFVVPVNAVMLVFYQNDRQSIRQNAYLTLESICALYASDFLNETLRADNYCKDLITDKDFNTLTNSNTKSAYEYNKYVFVKNFQGSIYNHSIPTGYFFALDAADDCFVICRDQSGLGQNVEKYVQLLGNEILSAAWRLIRLGDMPLLFRAYRIQNTTYGSFIEIEGHLEALRRDIPYQESYVLLAAGDESPIDAQRANQTEASKPGADLLKVMAGEFFNTKTIISIPVAATGFMLYAGVLETEIFQNLPFFRKAMLFIAIACLIIIPFLYLWLSGILIKPLKRISDALNQVESGDESCRIGTYRCASEFLFINRSFNRMLDQIEHLRIEKLRQEVEYNKMQLVNIKLQIRPHFMLNFFSTIYSLAEVKNFDAVQKMALYLSKYYRYLFSCTDNLMPLSSEVELIKAYLEISAMRYPHCFETVFDLADGVGKVLLPGLVVHNFVENIFKYAIDLDRFTHIRINAYVEEHLAYVLIEDDGPGMDAETLAAIRDARPVVHPDGKHIGIWNSIYRVKNLGEGADVWIESKKGMGTTVTIKAPIQ
jgi:sensor histidine kinase YesM